MDRSRRLTVSVTEAAELLGISRALAYELVARGELPSLQFGRRLVAAIPVEVRHPEFQYTFKVVNVRDINAFALPGGFVGVNTGLILLAQSESELASVLGHEITHVTQHHIARGIGNQRDALLMALGALAAAVLASRSHSSSSGDMTQGAIAAAQGLAIQSQINFTRQNEEEADRLGFERTYAAGFEPTAMAGFFERLQKASHKMAEALYRAAGGTEGAQAGGAPPAAEGESKGKDDVIDAEYTESPPKT